MPGATAALPFDKTIDFAHTGTNDRPRIDRGRFCVFSGRNSAIRSHLQG
jgi:hypothetical protein